MSYEAEKETITFSINDDNGGRDLFYIRNASYESAVKLAEGLGLDDDGIRQPICWSKWNPVYKLDYDKSEDAEKLRIEIVSLGLPLRIQKISSGWAWYNNGCVYRPPTWTVDKVLKEIRKEAKLYQKQLATKP
jgi:hypothetical protein